MKEMILNNKPRHIIALLIDLARIEYGVLISDFGMGHS